MLPLFSGTDGDMNNTFFQTPLVSIKLNTCMNDYCEILSLKGCIFFITSMRQLLGGRPMLFPLYFCKSLRMHDIITCYFIILVLHIVILLFSAIRLIFSTEKATLVVDFTITCLSNVRAIILEWM